MSKRRKELMEHLFGPRLTLAPGEEPIEGYRLQENVSGNVWKAVSPQGPLVAMKFVSRDHEKAAGERNAFPLIKDIKHPHLLEVYEVREVKDRVVVVMEVCEGDLQDLFYECQDNGLPGIPREQLLAYLAQAAQALDHLNARQHRDGHGGTYGVMHCDIRPDNLMLKGGHMKVGDLGFATAITDEPGKPPGVPSFATPPEAESGRLFYRSDQFSLAAVYCYLLTGHHIFRGPGVRDPDATNHLPEQDRPIVERALATDPHARWPTCVEFIDRLKG